MSILPSGYKRLEYIQSNKTQRIDTGFNGVDGMRVVMELANLENYTDSSFGLPFGGWNSSSQRHFYGIGINETLLGMGGYKYLTNPITLNEKHKIEYSSIVSNCYVKVDNISLWSSETRLGTLPNIEITLFAPTISQSNGVSIKLYSCKIYDNTDTLVRDFIPCKTNDEYETVGLYDLVTEEFYTTATSYTFEAGTEWNDPTTAYDGKLIKNGKLYARVIKGGGKSTPHKEGTFISPSVNGDYVEIDTGFEPNFITLNYCGDDNSIIYFGLYKDNTFYSGTVNPNGNGANFDTSSIVITDSGFKFKNTMTRYINNCEINYYATIVEE